jgi:DNA-binding MarR family transcriptional regulator
MEHFTISNDGKLIDGNVLAKIAWIEAQFGGADSLSLEAHLLMSRTAAVYQTALDARYAELGLSLTRFNVMVSLFQSSNYRETTSQLSILLDTSIPNTIRLVNALEEEGWVRRLNSEGDRRITFVELTAEGADRIASLLPRAIDIWDELWLGFSEDELDTFCHLLAKLRLSLLTRYLDKRGLGAYRKSRRIKQSPGRSRTRGQR